MRRKQKAWLLGGAALLVLLLVWLYRGDLYSQLEWRLDAAAATFRCRILECDTLPAPDVTIEAYIAPTAQPSATLPPAPTPTATPIPLPGDVTLPSPRWEKQDWNNCGPATLALALRFYGWSGDQYDISEVLKPHRGDRNVNLEELVYFVRTRAGWLDGEYRVAGSVDTLRRLIAAGYPVVVEEGFWIESDGPDAGWAGHYLLLTGYDDESASFISQDTYQGADRAVSYAALEEGWQAFNYVYLVLFPVAEREDVLALIGPAADVDLNRQMGLQLAQQELELDPENAYAWFNLGSNLLYFERYEEAAEAYETALSLGLPWRFLRYQFGPYITYFQLGRFQDLYDLANATLELTTNAEESLLWRGWARYRLDDLSGAIDDFRAALEVNPRYEDALYALQYVGAAP